MHLLCLKAFKREERNVRRPLASGLLLLIAQNIKKSLDRIHDLGLYHCDLKPENIFISDDSQVLISELSSIGRQGQVVKSSDNLPTDLRERGASSNISFTLLATTVLEMLDRKVTDKTVAEIQSEIEKISDESLKDFLNNILE